MLLIHNSKNTYSLKICFLTNKSLYIYLLYIHSSILLYIVQNYNITQISKKKNFEKFKEFYVRKDKLNECTKVKNNSLFSYINNKEIKQIGHWLKIK